MTKKEFQLASEIIRKTAQAYNESEAQVRREMEKAIRASAAFRGGAYTPTPEEFILACAKLARQRN